MFDLNKITRENVKGLLRYSSARDEFSGTAEVFLDANENNFGSPLIKWYNRYPDPHQVELKEAISKVKGIGTEHIFLGNGSDDCVDLLFRCFCNPGKDNVIVCPPTYPMYEVGAQKNEAEMRVAPLLDDYQLNLPHIETLIDSHTKIIWICSPNNPTGNSIHREDIETILNNFDGLVVIDEAYINFAKQKSFLQELPDYPNLVVLQTFSKAWGMAGLRLGMAMASAEIIATLNKIKLPYNINQATQEFVLKALEDVGQVNDMIKIIVDMRDALADVLRQVPTVEKVYPSDTNFLFVKIKDAHNLYQYLLTRGIVVRDRSNQPYCADCLRITVGTEKENTILVDAISDWLEAKV